MDACATAAAGSARSSPQPCTWMDTLRLAASIRNPPPGWAPHHSTLPLPSQPQCLAPSLRNPSPSPDGSLPLSRPPVKRVRTCASPAAEPIDHLWSREDSPSSLKLQDQRVAQLCHVDSVPDFCETSPLPSRHSFCSAQASPAAQRHSPVNQVDIAHFLAQPVDDLLRCGSQSSLALGPAQQQHLAPSQHLQSHMKMNQGQGEWLAKGMAGAAEEPTAQQSGLEALLCALGAPSSSQSNSKPSSNAWSLGVSGDSLEAPRAGGGAKQAAAVPEDQQLQLRQIQNLIWDVLYGDSEEQEQACVAANSPAPSSCSATGCAKKRGRREAEAEEEEVSCSWDSGSGCIDLNLLPRH